MNFPTWALAEVGAHDEPYIEAYWSQANIEAIRQAVRATGFPYMPSVESARSGMSRAVELYGRRQYQGSAGLLDPDLGREGDPAVQHRKLATLNQNTIGFITEAMETEKMAEGMYHFEMSTPLGDRLLMYPQYTAGKLRGMAQGSMRFLAEAHETEGEGLAAALASDPTFVAAVFAESDAASMAPEVVAKAQDSGWFSADQSPVKLY